MSATDKHNLLAGGSVAHVNFRVRGEKLGHGEEVFLVQQDDAGMRKVRGGDNGVVACFGIHS